jgi:hypothetical protein
LRNPATAKVAGVALVRMGQCYEKLGDKEARNAYERAIRDFADQPEIVSAAKRAWRPSAVVRRRVFRPPALVVSRTGALSALFPDGRLCVFTDPKTRGQHSGDFNRTDQAYRQVQGPRVPAFSAMAGRLPFAVGFRIRKQIDGSRNCASSERMGPTRGRSFRLA